MITTAFEELFNKLSRELPTPLSQSQLKSLMTSCLEKLDLVTREEFDAQARILSRSSDKIDYLEQQVLELEKLVKVNNDK